MHRAVGSMCIIRRSAGRASRGNRRNIESAPPWWKVATEVTLSVRLRGPRAVVSLSFLLRDLAGTEAEVAGLFVDVPTSAANGSLAALWVGAWGVIGGDAGPLKVVARPLGVIGETGKWSSFMVGVGMSSEMEVPVPPGVMHMDAEVAGGRFAKRCWRGEVTRRS